MSMRPASALQKPASNAKRVLLPVPDRPLTATISPLATVKSIGFSPARGVHILVICVASTSIRGWGPEVMKHQSVRG